MLLCGAGGAPRRLQYLSAAGSRAASCSSTSACASCDTNNCCNTGAIPPSVTIATLLWPQYLWHIILHEIMALSNVLLRCPSASLPWLQAGI